MKLISAIKLQSKSIRNFAIDNQIAYSVLYDICSGKKQLSDCKLSTIIKIAKGLNVSIDDLISEEPFTQFRDSLHNSIKQRGDLPWLIETLKENKAPLIYQNRQILHAIYLVDMIDYVCNKHGLPCPKEYQKIRELKLEKPYYIGDWHILSNCKNSATMKNAIPEFLRSNIIECEVYDAM